MSVDVICAADESKFSLAQQEVLDVSLARRDASNRRDMAALARYFAEDCLFSSHHGTVSTNTILAVHGKVALAYEYAEAIRPKTHIYDPGKLAGT
jgi:hypothetical protein